MASSRHSARAAPSPHRPRSPIRIGHRGQELRWLWYSSFSAQKDEKTDTAQRRADQHADDYRKLAHFLEDHRAHRDHARLTIKGGIPRRSGKWLRRGPKTETQRHRLKLMILRDIAV